MKRGLGKDEVVYFKHPRGNIRSELEAIRMLEEINTTVNGVLISAVDWQDASHLTTTATFQPGTYTKSLHEQVDQIIRRHIYG